MSEKQSTILFNIIKNFEHTKYISVLDGLTEAYVSGDTKKFNKLLKKIPTQKELLEKLLNKLKKKSIYGGLRKVLEGKDDSVEQCIISISSLITHVGIEIKEHKEYKQLLPDLYVKLGALIKKL